MKYIFSSILLVDAILAFCIALRMLGKKTEKNIENMVFFSFAMFSGIWSLGFGMLFLQTVEHNAYICRNIGIFGTIGYMITIQCLVCYVSSVRKRIRYVLDGISMTGVVLYFFAIKRDQITFSMSIFGMTYQFKQGVINSLYSAYFIIVAVNILIVIIFMIRKSKLKRLRVFGWRFFMVEILILFGTVLDMIFPAIGLPALPGSNVTQFWGLAIMGVALSVVDRSRITISNMSEYIYNSLSSPILLYDASGNLCIANDSAVDFIGIMRGKTGKREYRIGELFNIDENKVFDFIGKSTSFDVESKKKNAYCKINVSKIRDPYGDIIGYIMAITDLTEKKRIIDYLEVAHKKAESAKREADTANRAKSLFLANMSHEIRTPMNAIIGFSDLVLSQDISDEVREYVNDIKESSNNLLQIINGILDISKIESGKMEMEPVEYSTRNLFYSVDAIIRQQAVSKNLAFELNISTELPSVLYADEGRIREVLINLLNNSVKYTREGSVSLDVFLVDKEDGYATIQYRVRDTGIGIKKSAMNVLFDSFNRLDTVRNVGIEGTGLGLAIVKGIIDLMGGTIEVESKYGTGSIFTVTIKQKIVDATEIGDIFKDKLINYKEKDHVHAQAVKRSNQFVRCKPAEVLVVDDNPINRKVISKTLEKYGLNITVVESGFDCLEICKVRTFGIIFMDQMMPELDGTQTMRKLREQFNCYKMGGRNKIVALTANAISGVREELIAEGFDDYLEKPIVIEELERVLGEFIGYEENAEATFEETAKNNDKSKDITGNTTWEISKDTTGEAILEVPKDAAEGPQEISFLDKLGDMFDTQKGIMHCGNREDVYLEVLTLCFEDAECSIAKLDEFFETEDIKNFVIQVHALKSTAFSVGADQIGELAKALEMAGKQYNLEFIKSNYDIFKVEYEKYIDIIGKALNLKSEGEDEESSDEAVKQHFKNAVDTIKECARSFDLAGMSTAIRKVDKDSLSLEYLEIYESLSNYIDNIELDKIEELNL